MEFIVDVDLFHVMLMEQELLVYVQLQIYILQMHILWNQTVI